jgi:hypothetical protein
MKKRRTAGRERRNEGRDRDAPCVAVSRPFRTGNGVRAARPSDPLHFDGSHGGGVSFHIETPVRRGARTRLQIGHDPGVRRFGWYCC